MKNNKFVIGMSLSVFGAAALLAGCGNAKTYTITFVSNGSDVNPLTLEWGKSVTRPEDPTRVGYTFTGWYTDESCTIPFDFENTKVETSFSIYGGWTINSYTVSFVSNVEGLLYEPIVGKYGSSISFPTPERANYTFGGWYTDEACTEAFNGKISGSNITVYAKWIECTYNIAFNKNNEAATGTMDPVHISEADSDKKLPSNRFRLEGYDFKGWSDSATGEVKYADQEDLQHIPENANITLYAVWEIKHLSATFYSVEGGLTSSYATTNADYGEKVVLPESEPSYTGHTFTNYGKMVPTEDKVAVANKVYYKHIAEAGQQYMVNPVKADTNIGNMSLYEVSDVNISDEIIKGNAEFYARFVKNQYKVKIIDDVTDSESSVTLYTGESFALPTQAEKTGYTAKGFYLDEACTNKITTSSIIVSASDVTIYSHYSVNTYSILVKDGTRDVAQYNDVDFGSDITALVAEPSKIGYSFVGYYEDPLFDEESKIDLSTMPAKNLTLYAKFEINKHSLSFDIGEGASKDVTLVENIEYGTNIAALLSVGATRVGYDFGGWTLSPEITDGKMPDSDVVATANWIVQGKTITFNRGHDDDGKLDELQKKLNNKEISQEDYEAALASYDTTIYHVNFGEVIGENDAVVIPSDPTRTGYKFLGWFDSQGNKLTEEAFDNLVVPVNNVEYVAKWEAVEVDVTVHFMLANLVSEGGYTEDTSLQKTVKAVTASEFEWTSATADSVEHFVFDGSDKVTVKADGSSEMYAFYSRETYDVTFVKSDESASEVVQNVEYGSKVSVPSSLKEVGYSITTKIGDEPVSLSTHVVENNETITLYYEEAFGLILDYNGGVDSEGNEEGKVLGDPSTTVTLREEEPTRVGYTFAGYYTEKDGGTLIGETVDLDETGKLTIYAHWTVNSYTYSFFDDVPEEGVALTPITKNYGESILGEIPQPTKTGYTFEGWYKHPAGADPVKVTLGSTMGAEDLTLYAHWTVNSYKLTFDANGGAFLDTTTSKVVSGDYDSSFVKANLPADPTLSNKVFVGWSSVKDDASKIIDFDNYKYGAQDATVYAVWRDPIINFVGEETSTYAPIQETAGSDIEFLNEPQKEGYSFSGWAYVDKDGNFVDKDGKALADGADPERFYFNEMPGKDVYITALWSLNKYEVIYNSNGGSIVTNVDGSGNVITYTHGSTNESLVKPADPTREGYEFGGWYYVDGTVSGEWLDANKVFNGDGSVNAKTFNADDINVYARWIAKEYTIIYMNNGVVYGEPVVVKYGEQIPEVVSPESGNKAFVGWYTADGTGENWGELFDAYIMPAIDKNGGSTQITLYARFDESIKFVVYRDLDGNIICSGDSGMTLEDYILSVLKESEAYQEIYDAIDKAVKAATGEEGGSMLEISTLAAYATLCNYDFGTLINVARPELGLSPAILNSMAASSLSNEYIAQLIAAQDNLTSTMGSITALGAAAQGGGTYLDVFNAAQAAMGGDVNTFLGYGATALVLNTFPGIDQATAVAALVEQGIDETLAGYLYGQLSVLPGDYITTLATATNNMLATQELLTYLGNQVAANPSVQVYSDVYNAVMTAVGGGSQDSLVQYITGANVLDQFPTRDALLSFMICNASADVGVQNLTYVSDFVARFNDSLSPAANAELYALLAEKIPQGQDGLMEIATPIGLALENKTNEYNAYEAAGYVPFSSDPSKVFDHWEQIIEGDTITYIPASISKQQPVSDISVYGATNSTVTFSWNEVAGSYGYKVIVTVKKADGTVVEHEPHIVSDTNYKVSGLLKGDEVSIKVIALKAGPNGEYREFSSTVEAISLKDGTPISNVPIRLDSDPTVTEYLHSTENDIGKVSKSGDFYYVTKDDDGNETYIFFANTTYSFGGKAVNLVDASGAAKSYSFASVGVNDKNDPAIITNENLSQDEAENVMYFTAGDASVKKAIVRALPGSISYGTDFAQYNSIKVTNQTKNAAAVDAADFIAEQKEAYEIGVEIATSTEENISGVKYGGFVTTDDHGVATYHNNGFKFDVQSLAKTGKEMPLDRSYTFYKYNASKGQYEEIALDSIAIYDLDTDAFYFKAGVAEESDLFKVVIAAKADVKDEYTNTYVPEIYKKEDESGNSKAKSLKQEVVFKLVDGVNIYDSESLRSAMADRTVSGVNLHRNLRGKLPANSVVFVQAAKNLPTIAGADKAYVKAKILGSGDSELSSGDVDIVERTAIMSEKGIAGTTKIWVENNTNPEFIAANGKGYSYAGESGKYSIADAEWTNAKVVKDSSGNETTLNSYENGKFKIISTTHNGSTQPQLSAFGFTNGNVFERIGQGSDANPSSRFKDFKFNGNYFKIDASKVPFIRSSSSNSYGSTIATYSIQNVKSSIIKLGSDGAVEISNLELIGNTENSSAGLTGNEKNVGEIMKRASGGLSGINSDEYTQAAKVYTYNQNKMVTIKGVNVSNALIGLYTDVTSHISYSHVKNSWANGVYAYTIYGDTITVDHSVIESSGGAALQVDDQVYGRWVNGGTGGNAKQEKDRANPITGQGNILNCTYDIDYTTTRVENFVCGDEQWFKGYTMEVVALGLKSTINKMVADQGYTIIQTMTNPTTGLTGEYMNWVFFSRTDSIQNQENRHADDMGCAIKLGDYFYTGSYDENGFYFANPDSNYILLLGPVDSDSKVAFATAAPETPAGIAVLDLSNGAQQAVSISIVDKNTGVPVESYLYFRQFQSGLGWLQGMVQLFPKTK